MCVCVCVCEREREREEEEIPKWSSENVNEAIKATSQTKNVKLGLFLNCCIQLPVLDLNAE